MDVETRRKVLEEEIKRIKDAIATGKRVIMRGRTIRDVYIVPAPRGWHVVVVYDNDIVERMFSSQFLNTTKHIF